ncbi:MAG: fumarylacetoacetate hydrolase family protein [Pseudomonadota bacterium]
MNVEKVDETARVLALLRTRGGGYDAPLPDLPKELRPKSLDDAYAIQSALRSQLSDPLGPVAGWKIGCTTEVMQTYLGIDHPCSGTLFSKQVHQREVQLKHSEYFRLGLECEIAVRLSKPLLHGMDVINAIDSVMCSVEIVDERFADFSNCAKETLVADDFFSTGCVIGEPMRLQTVGDLSELEGGFTIDEKSAWRGLGSAILGNPLRALTWLAEHRAAEGGLKAGEIVTLGSVVKTIYPQPGMRIIGGFEGLGSITVEVV